MLYPPRPKSRMLPTDLPYYEGTGKWLAQRKFNGCRNLIHVTPNGEISLWSRDGDAHKGTNKKVVNKELLEEVKSALVLKPNLEYWLDSELMTKQVGASGEVILYDVLQAGRYFFGNPNQLGRLEILKEICGDPQILEPGGIALQITKRVFMAETFLDNFVARFEEAIPNPKLEGLVLKRRDKGLDAYGDKYYETPNQIRCRKPFAATKGYNF